MHTQFMWKLFNRLNRFLHLRLVASFFGTILRNRAKEGGSDDQWRNSTGSCGGADIIHYRTTVGGQERFDFSRTEPKAPTAQEFGPQPLGHTRATGPLAPQQHNASMFGLRLFSVANMALNGVDLRERAATFLQALMQRSRLTVHMAIIEGDEAVLIEKIEPPGLVRIATWVGKRMDLHSSGVGKCLLAYLPERELLRMVRDHGLTRYNENTITSIRKLKLQMTEIKQTGYSIEDEEGEMGCRCIGAPVFDHSGHAVAAISVCGTTAQITIDEFAPLGQLVRCTAADISGALGFVGVQFESSGRAV